MTLRITTAALLLAATPVFAQMSGVSHPDPTVITSDEAAPAPKPAGAQRQVLRDTGDSAYLDWRWMGRMFRIPELRRVGAPVVTHAMPVQKIRGTR